jgi:mannuronan synthase
MNFTPRTTPAIVHEAEVQRQHARYRIPLEVLYKGHNYRVADWSLGGFALLDAPIDSPKGTIEQFTLIFPFDTYQLSLTIEAEVKYNDRSRRRVGVKFLNLTSRQINVIRYVLDAFLSGEIVEAGDVLEVSARSMSTQSRAIPAAPVPISFKEKVRLYAPRAAAWSFIGLLAIGVLTFLAASLYDRLFVVHASSAMVAGNSYVLSSPIDGLIDDVKAGASLKPGDKVYTVLSRPGESMGVSSVCTCTVREVYAANGTYVREGDKVVSVLEPNSKQYVEALVERAYLTRLYGDVRISVRLIDGTVLKNAKIRKFPALLGREGSVELLSVEIDPGVNLPTSMIGRPAIVNFDDVRSSLLGRIFGIFRI